MKWSNRSQESIDKVDKVPFFFFWKFKYSIAVREMYFKANYFSSSKTSFRDKSKM